MSERLGVSVLIGLLIVCAFLGWRIMVLVGSDAGFDPPPSTTTTTARDAGPAFLAAWEGSLIGPYLVEGERVRTGELVEDRSNEVLAVREGRRLLNVGGTIVFQARGETQTCRQTLNELFCTPIRPVLTPAEELAELAALTGADGIYRVAAGAEPGCFDLAVDRSLGAPDPRLGLESRFCFDVFTGALVASRVIGASRTETWETQAVEAGVTADRLAGRFPAPLIDQLLASP